MAMIPRTAEQLIHELLSSASPGLRVPGIRWHGFTPVLEPPAPGAHVAPAASHLSAETDPAQERVRSRTSRAALDVGSALPATPFTLRIADDLLKIGFSAPRENVRAAIQVTVQQFSACHRAAHVGLPKLRSSRVSVCRDWASPITMREKSGWRGLSK